MNDGGVAMIEASTRSTVYGLSRPTLAEVRDAIERTHGRRAGEVWAELLRRTVTGGIAGQMGAGSADAGSLDAGSVDAGSLDAGSVDAIVAAAVASSDGITALCGRALAIRIATFDHLVVAERMMAPYGGRGPGR